MSIPAIKKAVFLLVILGCSITSWSAEQNRATISVDEITWANVDISPDGSSIIFDALGDIYTLPRTGGVAKALASGSAYEAQPKFSPDGRHIVFISDRSGSDGIWLMDKDGKNTRCIATEPLRKPSAPAFSADGRYIVVRRHYVAARSIGAGELWAYPVAGGPAVQWVARASNQKDINEPAYSADGRYLYFSQDVWAGDAFEYDRNPHRGIMAVQRLDLTTKEVKTMVAGPGGAVRPTPSPDGRWLAYVTRQQIDALGYSSALTIRDLRSGATQVISNQLDQDAQELWANHGYYPALSWLPDSTGLVYWARGSIWEQPINGESARKIPFKIQQSFTLTSPPRQQRRIESDTFTVKALRNTVVAPDGEKLAFVALGKIYLHFLETGMTRRLVAQSTGFENDPTFSSDGEWVVYTQWNDDQLGSVRRARVTDGQTVVLTQQPGHFRVPSVSPDSKKILFVRAGPGPLLDSRWTDDTGLYSIAWHGGDEYRISDDTSGAHFCERSQPWVVRNRPRVDKPPQDYWFNDRLLTELTADGERTVAVAPTASDMRVSPDCRWLAYVTHGTVHVASIADVAATPLDLTRAKKFTAPGDGGHFLSWSKNNTLHWSLGPNLSRWRFTASGPDGLPVTGAVRLQEKVSVPTGMLALVNAHILPMRGLEQIQDGVILINGDRIAAVGRADQISVPKNARVIDLQGRIVMPGLIDNHWHGIVHQNGTLPQQSWPLRSALAFGVTTIFDPAATQHIFSAGELVKAGLLRGPRIFSTGPTIYGAESDGTQNGEQAFIETLEDARREVRRRQAWGAIAVKSYLLPRREQRQYVVAAAREAGMFVASESAMAQIPAVSQIMDGETSIEHAISLPNVYQDILQLWRQSSIDTVPTMVIGLGGISGELLFYSESEIWRHPILSQHVPPVMLRAMGARNTRVSRSDLSVLRSARWLEQLRKAGIRVLPGSHGQREGLALHWEMWLMAEGGASAHEIFRAATLQSAEHLGVEADLGSVETGKIADLLVFDDNPLSDIRKSDRIKYVIANGIIYDPGSLNQL